MSADDLAGLNIWKPVKDAPDQQYFYCNYLFLPLFVFVQEVPLLLVGSFCLICSSASQTAAPFFFGAVVDAAQKTMGKL